MFHEFISFWMLCQSHFSKENLLWMFIQICDSILIISIAEALKWI